MKTLLMATDLSPRSECALNRALALKDELQARLIVIHVIEEEFPSTWAGRRKADRRKKDAESAIDDQLAAFSVQKSETISRKVVFGPGFEDILKEADENEADLVIVGTPRKERLGAFFLGTTAERVIRRGNDPVLLVRDEMQGPYRRVIIGVDFSVYSRRAVEFALKFVPHGEIFLVHAFETPFKGLFSQGGSAQKKHQEQMNIMLEEEKRAFVTPFSVPSSRLNWKLGEGAVRDVIAREVETLHPDLLVIGTHGRTGVAHALLGSVAENLLSDPPCDILAVKAW